MLSLNAIDGFIFDLDNTLIPSEPFHLKAFAQAMRDLANYELTPEDIHHFSQHVSRQTAEVIIRKMGFTHITPQGVADHKNTIVRRIFKPTLFPGAREFIQKYHGDKKMALASNSPPAFVNPTLEELGLNGVMDCVITSKDVHNVKPDPEMFLMAAERLNCRPSRTLVFEDSAFGLKAAVNGGFPSVLVLNPNNPVPDYIPDDTAALTWSQLLKV